MDTYEIRVESPNPKWKSRLIAALCFAGFFFLFRFGLTLLFPLAFGESRGPRSLAIDIGIWSLVMSAVMAFGRIRTIPNYTLLVDDDSITGVTEYTGWMSWLVFRRTVRRGEVRSIFPIKVRNRAGQSAGIGISERERVFSARMLGFVYVPKTLPQYEQLKHLAESWRSGVAS
jgi:hypothetical protein